MLREVTDRVQRRGQSLRIVASFAEGLGHPISHSSLASHLRDHVASAPADNVEVPDQHGSSALVALAAYDILADWYSLSEKLARRLHADGLHREADIVAADLTRDLSGTLESLRGGEVAVVFEAKVLAAALGVVLPRYPLVCSEVAAELARLDAPELASDFHFVAQRASQTPAPAQSADGTNTQGDPL